MSDYFHFGMQETCVDQNHVFSARASIYAMGSNSVGNVDGLGLTGNSNTWDFPQASNGLDLLQDVRKITEQ